MIMFLFEHYLFANTLIAFAFIISGEQNKTEIPKSAYGTRITNPNCCPRNQRKSSVYYGKPTSDNPKMDWNMEIYSEASEFCTLMLILSKQLLIFQALFSSRTPGTVSRKTWIMLRLNC